MARDDKAALDDVRRGGRRRWRGFGPLDRLLPAAAAIGSPRLARRRPHRRPIPRISEQAARRLKLVLDALESEFGLAPVDAILEYQHRQYDEALAADESAANAESAAYRSAMELALRQDKYESLRIYREWRTNAVPWAKSNESNIERRHCAELLEPAAQNVASTLQISVWDRLQLFFGRRHDGRSERPTVATNPIFEGESGAVLGGRVPPARSDDTELFVLSRQSSAIGLLSQESNV